MDWRDILVIAAFVVALLGWFGIGPAKLVAPALRLHPTPLRVQVAVSILVLGLGVTSVAMFHTSAGIFSLIVGYGLLTLVAGYWFRIPSNPMVQLIAMFTATFLMLGGGITLLLIADTSPITLGRSAQMGMGSALLGFPIGYWFR